MLINFNTIIIIYFTFRNFDCNCIENIFYSGTIRGNEQGKLNSNVDIGNENIKNEGASNFIKYLVHISGNKDLSVVTDIINNLKICKESLFPLCVFYEQLVSF